MSVEVFQADGTASANFLEKELAWYVHSTYPNCGDQLGDFLLRSKQETTMALTRVGLVVMESSGPPQA